MTHARRKKEPRRARCTLAMLLALLLPLAVVPRCNAPAEPEAPPGTQPSPDPPDPGPDPGPFELAREPYVQMLGSRSAVVACRTSTAASLTVDYGTTPAYERSATSPAGTRHEVELTGLEPGTRYHYRLRAGTATLAGGDGYFFDTDAGRDDPEFSFFVTGDVGEPGGEQATTAAGVLATEPRAEIGLVCGDVVYPDGESDGYDANLMRPWAPLLRNVAVWPALGNHDWHVDPDLNFAAEWVLPNNEHYYSFDRGNAHFVALDTRDGDIYDATNQVAWLRADLTAHRDALWTFVYYHHPGYTCTYKGDNSRVISRLHPVFDEFAVDVVFMGHAHTFERLYPIRGGVVVDRAQEPDYVDPGGTVYVITGCGAKTQNSTTPDCDINAVAIDRTIMFTHVTVRGRTVEIRTLESASRQVRDRVTITKTP